MTTMRMNDLPLATLRIRALQAMYPEAHQALSNWGAWSMDLRKVYPEEIAAPAIWGQGKHDENEAYGDWTGAPIKLPVDPIPIPADRKPYDERPAVILDERMHGPGGLSSTIMLVARTAYINHDIPEEQFPKLSGCTEDALCERLESLLRFVARFI